MRSRKKQLIHQKIFNSLSSEPIPQTPVIQWKTTPKIPLGPSANPQQSAPTPALTCENPATQSQNSAKQIINDLIMQNSNLRKTVYQLEHSMAIMRLTMQNKEFEYKNAIFEYREMVSHLTEAMGYSCIEEYEKEMHCDEKQASWKKRRLHLYSKDQESNGINHQSNSRLDSEVLESRRSRSLNKSISIEIYKQDQVQNSEDKKPFALDPCDFLNFNSSSRIQESAPQPNQKLKSLSSVTEVLRPYKPHNFIQIEQISTMNAQSRQFKATAQAMKAETERMQKASAKDKKSSGRVSSQAAYSNQSFKIIVQKGIRNRERIEQLFRNTSKSKGT